MTQDSRPWTGTSTGDAGAYSATEWQAAWKYAFGVGGARANVGPFLGSGTQPNDGLKVQAKSTPNTQIEVLAGSALVQGIHYLNDATVSFTISGNASGNPRIDTVVLRADYVAQTVRLAVLQGSPAASPTPLALTQTAGVTWEIPLADIAVANGFVTITNANITPRHEWINAAAGVYLDNILNNSGGTLQTGDVVIWDTSIDRGVTTTTTADDPKTAGVWVGRTANGGYGRVLIHGVGLVNGGAAITRGNILTSSGTAKQAVQNTTGIINVKLGRALETTLGAGLVLTFVEVTHTRNAEYLHYQDQKSSGTAAASITSGGWRTRELTTEVTDTANLGALASNQITLQPGTYEALITAEGTVGNNLDRLRLRDTTGGATLFQSNNGKTGTDIMGFGVFTITVASVLELQHYSNGTAAGGTALTSGDVEVYANVYLRRIGEAA